MKYCYEVCLIEISIKHRIEIIHPLLINNYMDFLLKSEFVSESFIERYIDNIDLDIVSEHQVLSQKFIEKYIDKLDKNIIFRYQSLSEEFMLNYPEFSDLFIKYQGNLSENFINMIWGNLNNKSMVSFQQILSEDFIRRHQYELNWNGIAIKQRLSMQFIEDFPFNLDIELLCEYQKLSNSYMINNFYKLNNYLKILCKKQELNNDFFDKFYKQLPWDIVCKYQVLSEDIIQKYIEFLDLDSIIRYQKPSDDLIKKLNIEIPDNCWIHKDRDFKIDKIRECNKYIIIDDIWIIAYSNDNYGNIGDFVISDKCDYNDYEDYNHILNNIGGLYVFGENGHIKNKVHDTVLIHIDDVCVLYQCNNAMIVKRFKIIDNSFKILYK